MGASVRSTSKTDPKDRIAAELKDRIAAKLNEQMKPCPFCGVKVSFAHKRTYVGMTNRVEHRAVIAHPDKPGWDAAYGCVVEVGMQQTWSVRWGRYKSLFKLWNTRVG